MTVMQFGPDRMAPMTFGWIGKTAMAALRAGVDVRPSLLDAGLQAPETGIDEETEIGPAEYLLMCALIINAVDDEMHGASSSRMTRGTANLVVKAIAAAPDLQSAIETFARFFSISGSFCRVQLDIMNGEATILVRSDILDADIAPVVEEMFVSFLHIQLSYYLGFLLPVSRIGTTSPAHPCLGQHHPYMLGRVSPANTTSMTFPATYLGFESRIRVGSNPLLDGELAWISRHAAARSGSVSDTEDDSLSGEVFRQLLRRDGVFEECCQALNLSPGEVRRGLWQEGASFRGLRRAALLKRSRPFLEKGASVEELAEALGYSDGRSVRRALKSATGQGISELRAAVASGAPSASQVVARLIEEKQFQL